MDAIDELDERERERLEKTKQAVGAGVIGVCSGVAAGGTMLATGAGAASVGFSGGGAVAGAIAGAATGAKIGAGVGIASGGTAIAGTVPVGAALGAVGAVAGGYGKSALVALGVISAPINWPLVLGVGAAAAGVAGGGAYLLAKRRARGKRPPKPLGGSYTRVPPIHGY